MLARENKKRKQQVDYTSATPIDAPGPSIKRGRNDKSEASKDAKPPRSKNTAVYVTNLPLDTEHDELVARFSKCGLLEEDAEVWDSQGRLVAQSRQLARAPKG